MTFWFIIGLVKTITLKVEQLSIQILVSNLLFGCTPEFAVIYKKYRAIRQQPGMEQPASAEERSPAPEQSSQIRPLDWLVNDKASIWDLTCTRSA